MKLVRWGAAGQERPGLIDRFGHVRDLGSHCVDLTPDMLAPDRLRRLAAIDPDTLPRVPADARLGVPVAGIGNILGLGFNYRGHPEPPGFVQPSEPVVFNKHTGALSGPFDDVAVPPGTAKLDWEVELAVVIGAPAWQVAEQDAMSHVAGYMTANDLTARDWERERGGQSVKGKSAPGLCPLGPWLVTADEIADPQNLGMTTRVNARLRQDGTTADMVFGVRFVVSYLSRFLRLAPGDVILTGSCAGVGVSTGEFLAAGDLVEVEVSGLGRQCVRLV